MFIVDNWKWVRLASIQYKRQFIYRRPTYPLASHMDLSSKPQETSTLGYQQSLEKWNKVMEEIWKNDLPRLLWQTNEWIRLEKLICKYSPNHACWSPCTSIASPKSANLTAAPFSLLANRRFSGCRGGGVKQVRGERSHTPCNKRPQDTDLKPDQSNQILIQKYQGWNN